MFEELFVLGVLVFLPLLDEEHLLLVLLNHELVIVLHLLEPLLLGFFDLEDLFMLDFALHLGVFDHLLLVFNDSQPPALHAFSPLDDLRVIDHAHVVRILLREVRREAPRLQGRGTAVSARPRTHERVRASTVRSYCAFFNAQRQLTIDI